MAKLDPYTLEMRQEKSEARVFTDPAQKGHELSVTFVTPDDPLIQLAIDELAEANIERYVGHPEMVPPVGGRRVRVTKQLCRAVAILQTLETPPDGERAYDFPGWAVLFMAMPGAMSGVMEWATNLLKRTGSDPKNA